MFFPLFISVLGRQGLQLIILEARGEAVQRHSDTHRALIWFSRGASGNCCTEEAKNFLKSWL